MSFVTGMNAQVGEELTVAWRLEDDEAPFQVLCRVRHTDTTQTGVEFLNLTTADRVRLSTHIARRSRSPSPGSVPPARTPS